MKLKTLRDLYIHELKDVYSAEQQITKALPKMAKAASSEELAAGFEEHLAVTEKQIERLDEIFEALGVSSKGEKCKGMEGLLAEGSKMMEEDASPEVLDAALIGAAQKVEHYEISSYGTLRTFAELLGEDEAARLLQETLDEEIETDERLTELAESFVNEEAEATESE
jgi:ferritin-like metal-binding protein YciE